MNGRLRSGALTLAASLALVGAATTAHEIPTDADRPQLRSQLVAGPTLASAAEVPLRSALLQDQAAGIDESATPVAVRIPELGLQASILSVGVDEDNRFAVPAAEAVGWYKHSATPGSEGSTVLAAHVDYRGRPGAFFNLADLEVGEIVEVESADGSVTRYRVTSNISYEKRGLPADELFRKSGDSVLQLITCGGNFDTVKRSYTDNVVVTAEPITA